MLGRLDQTLQALITGALPGLFGGASPPMRLRITPDVFEVDPHSADAAASEPRPDNRTDQFSLDPADPDGPYTLTRSPYPGPRRVRLLASTGDRIPVTDSEVVWDAVEPRRFSLRLRPTRDLAGVTAVQVHYGVTAVFTTLKAAQNISIGVQAAEGAADRLGEAEALVAGVIALNRQQLIDGSRATFSDGDYGTEVAVTSLTLVGGGGPEPSTRPLTLRAEVEVKATRALRADEGVPIERIRTPGQPLDPRRPVDIRIDVEA
jgi:hypothetical protein